MNILITGGSGFLGQALTSYFLGQALISYFLDGLNPPNMIWVSQNKTKTQKLNPDIQVIDYTDLKTFPQPIDIIINLAGAGIADKRWTAQQKQYLLDSRLKPTQAILDFISQTQVKPKLLISGSAIGWYGNQGEQILDEHSSYHTEFTHDLCQQWEQLALTAPIPTTIIRTGIVLEPAVGRGMLKRLLPVFRLGLGGRLGDGQQIMSWIALADWLRAVDFIMQRHLSGQSIRQIYNLTAPNPVNNAEFTQLLAKYVNRPALLPLPSHILKMIFGEMATLLIDGQKVLPKHLIDDGFVFLYPQLQDLFQQ